MQRALWQSIDRLKKDVAPKLVLWVPSAWCVLFFLMPFVMVLGVSFSQTTVNIPPYSSLFSWTAEKVLQIRLSFGNYAFIFSDQLYLLAYLNSICIGLFTTAVCLVIGYPMAYGIMRASRRWQPLLLMLVVLPFWTSFLVRVYAWIGLLDDQGILNSLLLYVGFIQEPLPLRNNFFAVGVGLVYAYLPFMILPLHASLDKIDLSLVEAASDLGCRPARVFWKIILPLSWKGALGGAMLVFIPAVGEFVIPELLGGSKTLMIGKVIWDEFFYNNDWPMAAALATLMLIVLLIPIISREWEPFKPN